MFGMLDNEISDEHSAKMDPASMLDEAKSVTKMDPAMFRMLDAESSPATPRSSLQRAIM